MKFVRAVWKLLVGIKDALVLMFMLLFFGLLYAGLSARPEPVKDGVLVLDLDGSVVEQPASAAVSELAGGSRPQAISPARPGRGARRGHGRRPRQGGRARPRRLHRRRPGGDRRPRRAVRRVRASGKPVIAYAIGYTDDSYQLAPPHPKSGSTRWARVADRRAGRLEPLLQGAARQARGDRQRLPRRHLQVGGRALHPQRHVARGAARMTGARRALARKLAREHPRARPKAKIDAFLKDMTGAVDAAGGDIAKAALDGRAGRQDRRPPSVRSALAELGGDDDNDAAGYRQIKLDACIADTVDRKPQRPDRHRHHRRQDRRRQGRGRHRRRRHASPGRSRTALRDEGSRRWWCGSTAPAGRCWRPSASARRSSPPRPRKCRWWCRWAASPHRAAIGSRPRPTSSSPSRRPSPGRSACSASCQLPGHAGQARGRRRRGQDHAVVGRAGPAQGPVARGRAG